MFCKYLLPDCGLPICVLSEVFLWREVLNLVVFLLYLWFLHLVWETFACPPMFSLRSFIVLAFMCKSVFQFEIILCMVWGRDWSGFSSIIWTCHLFKQLPLSNCLDIFVKKKWQCKYWLYWLYIAGLDLFCYDFCKSIYERYWSKHFSCNIFIKTWCFWYRVLLTS